MDHDLALVDHLARDLDGAFPALVAGHADRLYTIAHRLLGVPSDAEEVAQDALLRAYRALAGYEPDRVRALRLRSWLATITVNLARNRRRRTADRQPPASMTRLADAGWEPRDSGRLDPDGVAEQRAVADELARALLLLPIGMRAAVVLRHVDGLSVAETAAVLGRPEGTVKALVHRGLARLRHSLDADLAVPRPVAVSAPARPIPASHTLAKELRP